MHGAFKGLFSRGPDFKGREENRRLAGRSVGRGNGNLRVQLILPVLRRVWVSARRGIVYDERCLGRQLAGRF